MQLLYFNSKLIYYPHIIQIIYINKICIIISITTMVSKNLLISFKKFCQIIFYDFNEKDISGKQHIILFSLDKNLLIQKESNALTLIQKNILYAFDSISSSKYFVNLIKETF